MTLFVQCIEHMALGNHVIAESGKFRLLDDMLPEMQSSGDRVLIFSQFTMMMDIMEKYLKLRGHRYAFGFSFVNKIFLESYHLKETIQHYLSGTCDWTARHLFRKDSS